MRHNGKQPNYWVAACLPEATKGTCLALVGGGVELHAVVGEVALVLGEPLGRQGKVGEDEVADNGNDKGDNAL